MPPANFCREQPNAGATQFYRQALDVMSQSGIPFLVGGAYALQWYTGVERHTKDLDIFIYPKDCGPVLELFSRAGYRTELTCGHWLGKVFWGDCFIDMIFNSGNGICRVDKAWFEHAVGADILDRAVRLMPPEEMIWSKGFVMERERYDGADIAHLIRARAEGLDWRRLLDRFGRHWRVLFNHVVLFTYIYPGEQGLVPENIAQEFLQRWHDEWRSRSTKKPVCQGTLLSRAQYQTDVEQWGYEDARLAPGGPLTAEQIASLTAEPSGPSAAPARLSSGEIDARPRQG